MTYASEFWDETERYHDLAEHFDRNIAITHPKRVTSNRLSPYFAWSRWNRTAVTYYEYRGERPSSSR